MKSVNMEFYPDNLELIQRGLKTSTLRSDSQASKINLLVGESGLFGEHVVTYHGKKFVHEAGGRDSVWKSEGFDFTESGKPKFKQTYEFLEGKISLHYYTFKPVGDK